MRAEPATVGYHFVTARRQDPRLEAAHAAAAGTKSSSSLTTLARMEKIIAWIGAEGRLPRDISQDKDERSMARWLADRRREARAGRLHRAHRDGLAGIPGLDVNPSAAADEVRWQGRITELRDFLTGDNDWPRHHHYASELEHTLRVWVHAQRQKRRRGDVDPATARLLDDTVPGWRTGRTRGFRLAPSWPSARCMPERRRPWK